MATITINRTPETHPLTWRVREDKQPVWLEEYCSKVGYQAAKKALTTMTPDEVINVVKEAGLRGRGGAGFPTGVKWGLVSKDPNHTERYLLCNADEMEPGTYKDRYLMENLPHLLIESMVISAFALGTFRGYIFIRGEYIEAAERLKQAIEEAKAQGLLGKNIFGTDFSFDLFVHTGAGRYICGEETALINSLEGRRANPRAKPPFPALIGAWGKPSCVNNVETLCNIAGIIQHGAQWYQQLSPEGEDAGTKMMGFSGRVNNPGLWELPFGVSAREILEEYAGGMQAGLTLKAWQPGGAGTAFLLENQLDTPMSYSSISKIGARMGTGLALAIDNEVSMVGLLHNLETFFARESCGWCSPCRDGLPWSVHILAALKEGRGEPGDIATLEHLCRSLSPGHTFCSHAPGAVEPLQTAIKNFRAEFEAGISAKPAGNSHSINGIQPNLLNVRW